MMRFLSRTLAALAVLVVSSVSPEAQTEVVKYGADFLASGVGARALGMGGAYVAHADDVTAGYWNAAGLDGLRNPEIAYMHTERFGGLVAFDYGAIAWPITPKTTVGVSFVRSGVDDIASTLRAFNPDTGLPNPDAESQIDLFSAADNAVYISASQRLRENLTVGSSFKVIRRGIGDFATAWGYSLDLAAQYQVGRFRLGANLQDVTTMVQSWSVNEAEFEGFEETFGVDSPVGLTEVVLPLARLGAATTLPLSDDIGVTLATDLDLGFDGQSANVVDAGGVSFRPRIGGEVDYKGIIAFRAGISDVTTSERFGTQITPSVGVGLNAGRFDVDYGFGDFAGVQGDLGVSHRISLRFTLTGERFARPVR
ncbi:PorV/PorQ family protein [Rubricoccus marinus]|nr:PorV/PorQ family protein [Rubricoccus marinus]